MGYRGRPDIDDLLPKDYAPTIIIIGTGPVGIELANQLIEQGWRGHIKLFGQADYKPYRRDMLPKYLEGAASKRDLKISLQRHPFLVQHTGSKIVRVDTHQQQLQDEKGYWHYYDKLVIATGASIQLPDIPGISLSGVYRFRNMKDAPLLMQNCVGSQHVVVVGGGAIGLETARAMQGFAKKVTLVQQAPSLMPSVLEPTASRFIQLRASQLGIQFRLSRQIAEIHGVDRVIGARLTGGESISCDKIIFTEKTAANTELAAQMKLDLDTGVLINRQLTTSIDNIYAIGECSQMLDYSVGNKHVALQQAKLLAENLIDRKQTAFVAPTPMTQTEVLGIPVLSIGDIPDLMVRAAQWQYQGEGVFRQVWLQRGKLVGAVAIGHWTESEKLIKAAQEKRQLWPWHKSRFSKSGTLQLDKVEQSQAIPLSA